MTRTLAAVGLALAGVSPAPAQIVYAPGVVYGPGFGGGFAYRGGFAAGGPGFRVGGFVRQGFYAAPAVPYFGWVPVAGPGWGPGSGNPFFLGPPAGLAAPDEFHPAAPFGFNVPANPDPVPARNPDNILPIAANKDEYLVIRPKPGGAAPVKPTVGEGAIVPKLDRVAPPPERPRVPAFVFDPFADRRPAGKTDTPEADPGAEAARQVKLAREAFAAEHYGAAAEHLDRALRAKPGDALPHFLKGQAQFAAGQYAEAVGSIRDGLKLAPDWPAGEFKATDEYGRPDRYAAQLEQLRKATSENPDEPALQFLLGYQLWFAGDRDAARRLFRAVAGRVKDAAVVERFLRDARRE